jgi:hypothetical protein
MDLNAPGAKSVSAVNRSVNRSNDLSTIDKQPASPMFTPLAAGNTDPSNFEMAA